MRIKFLLTTLQIEQLQNFTMCSNSRKARNNKLLREKKQQRCEQAKTKFKLLLKITVGCFPMWRHFGSTLVVVLLRQVHTYPNIFESASFLSPSTRSVLKSNSPVHTDPMVYNLVQTAFVTPVQYLVGIVIDSHLWIESICEIASIFATANVLIACSGD